MKDVNNSAYIEDRDLMNQSIKEKSEYMRRFKIIANVEVLDHFFIV